MLWSRRWGSSVVLLLVAVLSVVACDSDGDDAVVTTQAAPTADPELERSGRI